MAYEDVDSWLSYSQVSELLGISKGKVSRLVEEHYLISVRREGEPMVPAHLIVDGEPLSSIRGTITVLLDCGFNLEEASEWIYSHQEELGHAPIASLLQGRKSEVRRLAQSLA